MAAAVCILNLLNGTHNCRPGGGLRWVRSPTAAHRSKHALARSSKLRYRAAPEGASSLMSPQHHLHSHHTSHRTSHRIALRIASHISSHSTSHRINLQINFYNQSLLCSCAKDPDHCLARHSCAFHFHSHCSQFIQSFNSSARLFVPAGGGSTSSSSNFYKLEAPSQDEGLQLPSSFNISLMLWVLGNVTTECCKFISTLQLSSVITDGAGWDKFGI
jgi:hypothetical protein